LAVLLASLLAGAVASGAAVVAGDAAGAAADVSPERIRLLIDRLAGFGTRHSLSDTESPTRGIGAARRWIHEELKSYAAASGGRLEVQFEEFDAPPGPRVPAGTRMVNVVAILPGAMPEAAGRRYYIVGHYDSMCGDVMDPNCDAPGANDDASGTAAVMEAARVLASRRLDATIVFLCTAGEEQGLIGAKYHAEHAASRGEDIRAVLSNDIVGDPLGPGGDEATATRDRIRVFSEGLPRNAPAEALNRIRSLAGESDSSSRQLARFVADVAEREGLAVRPMLIFRLDRFLRGGDHSAFNEAGFPAIRFTEVHEDYRRQHQFVRDEAGDDGRTVRMGDLPEFVDEVYLADVTRLNVAALVHLASSPSPPADARIITAQLAYDTTLRWTASPEPDVAGYEVVWRDTTAPDWEHTLDVGNATEATINQSKDNVFFGVRAYDRDGFRSPVVFPGAARE
jgi:hypothetical protein